MLTLHRSEKSKAAPLEAARASARARIFDAVSAARAAYVSPLPGQSGVYLEKRAEATAFLALDLPPADLAGFPYMAAEVGLTAPTAADLAQLWLAKNDALRTIGPQIEAIRMTAQAQLEAATSAEAVAQVADDTEQALEALT